jgi:Zn-dependent protease with chaperone function
MQFEADYYDGISPRGKRIRVVVADQRMLGSISNNAIINDVFDLSLIDCHVQAKLGNAKRRVDLPEGRHLETDFQDLEQLLPAKTSFGFWRVVHYAETHLIVIVLALIGTLTISLAMLKYGVPVAAKYAALATPELIEKDLGKQTLEILDHEKLGYFQASKLTPDKQTRIQNAFVAMCKKTQTCPAYDLNFRSSKAIGANAFALPGGYMVITDELVALADNDDEITAVLAHELGHVKLRHALRQTLQGTISGLIVVAITGDISSIAAGLPALMVNMSYSRELETEADTYALQSLNTACIAAKSFSTILSKLSQSHGEGMSLPEIISSHPDTKSRMIPFEKDQRSCT